MTKKIENFTTPFIMKSNKNQLIVLYIKDKKISSMESSQQTKKIRNDTNQRIRDLGNRYFDVKNLFDKMNLKRDDLFCFGKQLVNDYKQTKEGIRLQNTKKRMKDALICWFAEHFYEDIFMQNSVLLAQLSQLSKNPQKILLKSKSNPIKNKPPKTIEKAQKKKVIPNDDKIVDTNLDFHEAKTNQEIDNFELSNLIQKDNVIQDNISINDNFDFNKIFQF